jgi:hypothetical protein
MINDALENEAIDLETFVKDETHKTPNCDHGLEVMPAIFCMAMRRAKTPSKRTNMILLRRSRLRQSEEQ